MDFASLTTLRVELGAITQITVSRPKALNALNKAVLSELDATLATLARDPPRCLIVTGEGQKSFVAGADIAELSNLDPAAATRQSAFGQGVFSRLERFAVPTIAAVNGFALGGGLELALACDLLYASENAKFGLPEVKLGLMPGFGGAVRLPKKIGLPAASEWLFTGEMYDAETALRVGLARELLPPDQLLPRVRQIAETIASRGPLAVRAAKKVLVQGFDLHTGRALELEHEAFGDLFKTADMREGTKAFLEKRPASFKGE